MPSVSKLVRDTVKARLQSAWATALATVAPSYTGVPAADVARLSAIDWAGSTAKQVFQGQINIDQLEDTTALTWPVVIIYTSDVAHDGLEKFAAFSGSVAVNIEFHYAWLRSSALPNFDEFMDLIEDALITVLHNKAWLGALSGLTYTGNLTAVRGQVQQSSQNWAQAHAMRLVFGVDV